ncbi:glycoside hydrolase family 3 N-terminal domain-containing protein [Halanaerocella petrolearia]
MENITAKVDGLLSKMTLEEKVAQLGSVGPEKILENGEFSKEKADQVLTNGIGQITRVAGASGLEPKKAAKVVKEIQDYLQENTRLGIPAIIHEECLSGYMGKGGTTYPQSIGLASSWSPELIEKITGEIRQQLKAIGSHLALSPVADVARDIRWGRIEETFGEDQYLVANMVTAYAQGLHGSDIKDGIYATLKHFVGHAVPEGGRNHAPVNLSQRTLRENHLFPFKAAIKEANISSVMNAYHDLDGVPCAASKKLLTDILRGELGFEGVVVSDYWSIDMLYMDHHVAVDKQEAGIKALKAGLDIELPEVNCYGSELVVAVRDGLLSETVIDQAVKRHLKLKFRMGIFTESKTIMPEKVDNVFETEEQRELAREAARKSMVLLKNNNDLLPLDDDIEKIAVVGPSGDSTRNLLGDYAYSAHVGSEEEKIEIVSILEGIKNRVSDNTEINYVAGCDIMGTSKENFAKAVEIVDEADIAVVAVGGKSGLSGMGEDDVTDEEGVVDFSDGGFNASLQGNTDTTGEHHDRTNLQLPGVQKQLVQAISETDTPVVGILVNGRPLAINWMYHNLPAILETWLPGEEGGNAVADILFGNYSPSGKLPVSIPKNVGQLPINYNRKCMSANRGYVFVDNEPLFPFGYGLSYTTFVYRDIDIDVSTESLNHNSKVEIRFKVQNTGTTTADEIAQLYISDKVASLTRPVKELKGFKRVTLKPKEEKELKFILSVDQLAFYDEDMNLTVEPGEFEVMIGSSSDDIRLKGEFELTGRPKEVVSEQNYFSKVEILN